MSANAAPARYTPTANVGIPIMKILTIIGAVLLLLGVLSFLVPVPRREAHSVKIGDAKFGVETQSSEKLPLAASVVIVVAGAGCMILGSRKG